MTVMRFVDRPARGRRTSYAARYVSGGPLDDLVAVAHKMDSDAAVAEAPALSVAVVRYLQVPDDRPAYVDYEVVPDGHFLVYSEAFHLLYVSDTDTFHREHTES